jgi:predicted nucleic-acid-binding protein
MIGIDTNILIRAITQDDPVLSPLARSTLENLSSENEGVVNAIVLAELAWTLKRGFDYDRLAIIDIIEAMLRSQSYHFPDRDALNIALSRCRFENLHFADAMIGELNVKSGCKTTLTFDVGAGKTALFTMVG